MTEKEVLIDFANKIGQLSEGLKNLRTNFDRHIREHKLDRIMQWVIIGMQTLVILFLGYLKVSGKMG